MLLAGFILKIALKIAWNVWSIQALHTGGEAFLTEKNVQAYQQHINILVWKHQKKLKLLLSNFSPLVLDKFYQKSQFSFHLESFCLQFMLKYGPVS